MRRTDRLRAGLRFVALLAFTLSAGRATAGSPGKILRVDQVPVFGVPRTNYPANDGRDREALFLGNPQRMALERWPKHL